MAVFRIEKTRIWITHVWKTGRNEIKRKEILKNKIRIYQAQKDQILSNQAPPTRGQPDRTGLDVGESYRELILENIEYDYLCRDDRLDRDMLNELVELMVDTVCSRRETIRRRWSDPGS